MPKPPLSALLLFCLVATPAVAQVRVTAIAKAGKAVKETKEIRLAPFADFTEVNHLALGVELADGDLLTALKPDLFVELTCPRGTLLRLTGAFRTVVSLPDGVDCGLEPLNGAIDVLTDQPTEIGLGGKTLGTPGTRYAVRLSRDAGGPNYRILVFEGEVELKGYDLRRVVSTSRSLRFTRAAVPAETQAVTPEEIQRWAGLYARFDLAKAEAAGIQWNDEHGGATEAALTRLHAAVLQDPAAARPRLTLAKEQARLKVGDEALYNLQRTKMIAPDKLNEIHLEQLQHNNALEYQKLDKILLEIPPDTESLMMKKKILTTTTTTPPPGNDLHLP
ncbi:MAG TPA: hypothetical protein DD490_33905 [Acidobacteria bacterium]|nr:hypothetical protein [Acidobacteriota bacterium]